MSVPTVYPLPPRYYRLFAHSLSGFAIVTALTGAAFGDLYQAAGGVVALFLSLPLFGRVGRLPEVYAQAILHGINLACLTLVSLTHAEGSGSGPMYMAFCMSSVTFSTRNLTGLALVLAGGLVIWYVPSLAPVPSPVPPAAGLLAPLFLLGAGSSWLVGRSRARTEDRFGELVASAERLAHDGADLLARRAELEAVGAELAERNAALEARLERSRQTTAELAARRADEHALVTAIHHDLREPLRSVVSFSQLLSRRLRGREDIGRASEFLALAVDGGRRMTGMLDDLVAYAGPGAEVEAMVPVDLRELAAEVTADLAALIDRCGATVTVDGLGVVPGHRALLVQLLLNLVGNALKFSRPGVPPRIEIVGDRTGGGAFRLSVRDNGVGIPPERLGVIFDLFRRVEAEAHREGSGIGLALCRRIALRHGADLTVTSVPGEGSVFRVTFPVEAYRGDGTPVAPQAAGGETHAACALGAAPTQNLGHGA